MVVVVGIDAKLWTFAEGGIIKIEQMQTVVKGGLKFGHFVIT